MRKLKITGIVLKGKFLKLHTNEGLKTRFLNTKERVK